MTEPGKLVDGAAFGAPLASIGKHAAWRSRTKSKPSGRSYPSRKEGNPGSMLANDHHLAELAIALKPYDPRHVAPPPLPVSKKVLDIGCGAGQTMIAAYPDRVTYGLDIDPDALALGMRIAHNVRFAQGRAERLPFSDGQFDLVVSRVTIPYTRIQQSLQEIHRVLKPGGELWMTLHSFSTVLRGHNWRSLRSQISLGYVVANSLLFYVCQKQFSVMGRCESFQTMGAIRRALEQTHFVGIETKLGRHFVVQARVPGGEATPHLMAPIHASVIEGGGRRVLP